ncbi:MAG: dienelactone hydrolase family protein [Bacteroidales bacterium]|nr:dienelactone hydrolase family protein [Bacteroidales bacterium]
MKTWISILLSSSIIIVLLTVLFNYPVKAQIARNFEPRVYHNNIDSLPYRIMFPENFDPLLKYPLILFLHGAGERGNNNESQLIHGGRFFASDTNRQNYPSIVVFPQCPADSYWANVNFSFDPEGKRSFSFDPSGEPTLPLQLVMQLLDSMLNQSWVDKDRFYLGGLSMGGMGTFELLYRKPEVFAAAFPICGGGNPDLINEKVKSVEIWAFHGQDDPVVLPELSVKMIAAVEKAGSKTKLTLYPDVGHNAWDHVFLEPELLPWLFSVRR